MAAAVPTPASRGVAAATWPPPPEPVVAAAPVPVPGPAATPVVVSPVDEEPDPPSAVPSDPPPIAVRPRPCTDDAPPTWLRAGTITTASIAANRMAYGRYR